jgi:sugar (pentulose or hexulose) kinase
VDAKQPDTESKAYYDRAYRVYGSLYPALRQAYQDIGKLDA